MPVCVCHSQQASTHFSSRFLFEVRGGWGAAKNPRKNRHPTSMLNLEMVCCLEVVRLCEIDSRATGSIEYTLNLRSHRGIKGETQMLDSLLQNCHWYGPQV